MKQETAEKAARWWANQLREGAKLDHGDDSPTGKKVIALAYMAQEAEEANQSPAQIDAFEIALAEILMAQEGWVSLSVDYHPGRLLLEAAEKANLSLGMATLPWKTGMWIDGDDVEVACGYGASPVKI